MSQKKRYFLLNASLLKRILSLVLDILLVNLTLGYPLQKVIESTFPKGSVGDIVNAVQSSPRLLGLALLFMLFISVLTFLYLSIFEWKLGQTPAMMVLGLRVISDDGPLTFAKCAIRSIFIFPFFPIYLLWAVDPAYMFFHSGRRLSEVLSKTRTVEEMR